MLPEKTSEFSQSTYFQKSISWFRLSISGTTTSGFLWRKIQNLNLDSADVVVSPSRDRYVFKPGEKITLTFRYRKAPDSEFIWFKCGRLDESKPRSLDPNNIEDITVLVQINEDRTVRPVESMPMEYNRRVNVIGTGDGLDFIIDPLRASDQGRYICILQVYDNNESRTKSIRSTYVTLTSI